VPSATGCAAAAGPGDAGADSPAFDEVIHAPNRLKICALLATATTAEFGTITDALDVVDSVTSKQLEILADTGYVTLSDRRGPAAASRPGSP
jgi:DNA-binding transcriptional ArsR family regulator